MDGVSVSANINTEWESFILLTMTEELNQIIAEEHLKPAETKMFMATAFRDGEIRGGGTAITKILPPISRFSPTGGHAEKKERVLIKLHNYFERFSGLMHYSVDSG